jgi:hypothetical protein
LTKRAQVPDPAAALAAFLGNGCKPNKYRAQRTGRYASKAEARYAAQLHTLKQAGAIADFLEQVGIRVSEGVRYVVDFVVFEQGGGVRFVEVKGLETAAYRIKVKLLKEAHPWIADRLEVVRAK